MYAIQAAKRKAVEKHIGIDPCRFDVAAADKVKLAEEKLKTEDRLAIRTNRGIALYSCTVLP